MSQKQILHNLAVLDLLKFCKEQGIDTSGTLVFKHPHKQEYSILKEDTLRRLATVTFYKNRVPQHRIVS